MRSDAAAAAAWAVVCEEFWQMPARQVVMADVGCEAAAAAGNRGRAFGLQSVRVCWWAGWVIEAVWVEAWARIGWNAMLWHICNAVGWFVCRWLYADDVLCVHGICDGGRHLFVGAVNKSRAPLL
jgi:hypothetical protein